MAQTAYSIKQLYHLGRANYENLTDCCERLEKSGYWSQVQAVMNQSAHQVLDLYVQSVLLSLANACGEIQQPHREYMKEVTDTDPLEVWLPEEITPDKLCYGEKTSKMPPILIQICGVYDDREKRHMAAVFTDSLLNVLLSMSYLDGETTEKAKSYIREFFDRLAVFLPEVGQEEQESYITWKLQARQISSGVEKLVQEKKMTSVCETSQEGVLSLTEKEDDNREREKQQEKLRLEEEQKRLAERQARIEEDRKRLEEEQRQAKEEFQKVKKRLLEREKAEKEEQERRLAVLLDELGELVGLESVKEEIQSLINLIKVRKMREAMNLPAMDMSYHMVFTGSPGTGKTTVARLVAKIYRELGILTEGQLIETDRSRMVAGYVGQTAINVREIVEQAIGGVLFIDEAYALVSPDTANDFGSEAVDTLVKMMEDHRDNLVVIVAGYTEEMQVFLRSNTGLISRFNKFIAFEDYTEQQLLDILEVMVKKAGLDICPDALEEVGKILCGMSQQQRNDFGNARGVRNIFERLVTNQANRLVMLEEPSREDLILLKKEDTSGLTA